MRFDAPFRRHEGGIGKDDVGKLVPFFLGGEGVVLLNMRVNKAVEVEVDQREAHHVGRDVVAFEVAGKSSLFVGRQGAVAVGVGVGSKNVLVGGDKESGCAASWVENDLLFFGVEDLHHEVDDVARGAELPGVALGAEHGEQVFEGIAKPLGVVLVELVDDFQEAFERFGVAVGQIGVLEDGAEKWRNAGVLRH